MQTWLAVEKDCVSIGEVSFNDVTNLELVGCLVAVCVLKGDLHHAYVFGVPHIDKICAGMEVRPIPDQLS
jgi:hypothetical protein